ncbi:ankyrin repeat protein [Colletotrichum asianum]
MSGVEAGATIVGFGLTSLKTFYQFISNVKDGPERVRDLANDLKSLQAAYERIQALGDLPGIFASSLSLTDLLKDCNEHIERLQDKVGKLQVQPSDKFRGVVWKRLKMALNDVEIAQDLSILSSYVNKFMLEISVIELQNAGHMSQLVAGGERQITMARQQHSILDQVGKDVGEFFPQIKQVQNGVDAVAVKITNLQSLSVRQSIGIAERLEKLETVVARMSLRNKAPGNEFGIHDNIWPVPQEETENSAILASIQSLCGLVDRQERLVESDEAQDILEDLETLLEDIESSKTSKDRRMTQAHIAYFRAGGKEFARELRKFHGILSCSTAINQNPSTTNRGKIIQSCHTLTQQESQHGVWLISTQRKWRSTLADEPDETLQESAASFVFRPTSWHWKVVIKVTVKQYQKVHGFYSLAPAVSVSRIRPRDSKVFSCVKSGEKRELVRLLASGQASLQDRDDKGATLLHYAFGQPAMCQYLIKHGADVDDVANVGHLLGVNASEPEEMLALWQSVLYNGRKEIDARDDIGRTSLHYLVYQIRRAGWTSEDDRKSLICLIQNGADIHSRDDAGLSIWDAAKKNNKQGSYARDMWDFVLAYCGFHSEVEAFARETPRHAVYRQGWYSRADFEEIWKGMEHLCPYYGDEASGLDCASFISETPSSSRRPYISDSWASTSSSIDGSDIDQMTPDQQQDLSEDESVKTWLSKPSVSSDMSDSPSAASLQYLGNAEVGFSEEVYENPWAEG